MFGTGVLSAGLLVLPAGAAPGGLPGGCTKFASAGSPGDGDGSAERPFESIERLVSSLAAGETGCLAGAFHEDVTIQRGGAPGAPITLTSAPGRDAAIVGRLYVPDRADDVVVSNLRLDGRNDELLPSPTVMGDRVSFIGNDVTNGHTAICFIVGSTGRWGVAVDLLIQGNRIHDCGELPATNHHHGIYVESSRGARILDNVIYDNADRGIQLYPDAQGTLIQGNVIDGNGQGILFSGDEGLASSGNRVVGNVISNSALRYNVESWYPDGNPVGEGNLAERNCVWNGRRGNVAGEWGFRAEANVEADPQFVDRDGKDFRLRPGSPCAAVTTTAAREPAVARNAASRAPAKAPVRQAGAAQRKASAKRPAKPHRARLQRKRAALSRTRRR